MLAVGDTAPDFAVTDHHGNVRRLEEFRGQRLLIWFYPKADTPG